MSRRVRFTFLYLFVISFTSAQVVDDFNQGTLDEDWIGDRASFVITEDAQLRLSNTSAGVSTLIRPFTKVSDQSWEWWFEMDFNPSNNNYLEYFLWLDEDINHFDLVNGYSIRIGENGTADGLILNKIIDGAKTIIAKGEAGIASLGPVTFRIQAYIQNDTMHINVDDLNGACYLDDIVTDIEFIDLESEAYFGFQCTYTTTRKDKFYFDDIYVGNKKIDNSPPKIESISIEKNSINIYFSEKIDTIASREMIVDVAPEDIILDYDLEIDQLEIITRKELSHEVEYEVSLFGIYDISGNVIDTILYFTFDRPPLAGQLLINEILFDPIPSSVDYLELYNQSLGRINLIGLKIENQANNRSTIIREDIIIMPGDYILLTKDPESIVEQFPDHKMSKFFTFDLPPYANESGNITLSFEDDEIDRLDYDEDMHNAFIDDTEGISLERIDFFTPTAERKNWTSGIIKYGGGSPGKENKNKGVPSTSSDFEIFNKVFSKSTSNIQDLARLKYQLDDSGYIGSAEVYNDRGQYTTTLFQNSNMPSSGEIIWNGTDLSGESVPDGIYILQLKLFHINGGVIHKKFTFGVVP